MRRFLRSNVSWKALLGMGWGIGVVAFGAGCGRQAIATTDALPVARVIVYRNGVAYFEREGRVDGDEVRFKMKKTEVGDFLATLAVMERGGSSVRAAAFPLPMDDDNDGARTADGDDAKPGSDGAKPSPPPPTDPASEDKRKGLETVLLSLDGKSHDLQVGYVAESPVWRPSYRLVVRPGGEADLQVWGIVQNLSGEDWRNVKLSLIAGAPLAFQADLGTPVIPSRPTVTDEGEVIAAVPRGETSLGQAVAPPPPPVPSPAPVAEPESDAEDDKDEAEGGRSSGGGPAPKKSAMHYAPRNMPAPGAAAAAPAAYGNGSMAASSLAPSAPRNLRSLAAVAIEGGSTRYDLPLPVTIPDRSATMVMLLSRTVAGEALFLYAPDGGVPDSSSHPFRVARFTNGASGLLERGPIAVFEGGAFLGQGMVDPLPTGATATVPFALERSIAVDEDRKYDELGARIAKIENGDLTVERDRVTQTKYRLRNGGDDAAKILVKHPRAGGARLFNPPAGTEDNVGTGSALVPATIAPRSTVELVVDERQSEDVRTDWFVPVADAAVQAYIADANAGRPNVDASVGKRLAAAWVVRNDIVAKAAERQKLREESSTLSAATEETRRNLRAIEKNKTAEALRQKLTGRLAEAATKLDDMNRREVELEAKLAELSVQFKEAIRELKVVAVEPGQASKS
jgi:Domain of unknown function (DUF4139)